MRNPIEGPLARELREIGEGKRVFPTTSARRHHFVPAFLLAKFADPRGNRKGWMHQLDTASGKPQRTTPDSACFQKDLYVQNATGERDNVLEALFSIVENHSAPAIERLVQDPLHQSPEDRETLSYFLAFHHSRSPVALTQMGDMSQLLGEVMFGVQFEDPVAFRQTYREAIEEEASDDEIETFRRYIKERLTAGEIRFSDPKAKALELLLTTADAVAETIHQLQWTVVDAGEGEFVISDRALAMFDPTLRFPWSGHAWRSSPHAQTTVPLGPEHTLLVEVGPPRTGRVTADATNVRKINLRTYGWASRFVYGRSQQVVTELRREAKKFRGEVVRPRPMQQVMLVEADPDDPTIGREHAKRGWPRGLWIRGDDGRPCFMSYTVLDPTDSRVGDGGATGAEIGRRVIEGAVATGQASADRLGS